MFLSVLLPISVVQSDMAKQPLPPQMVKGYFSGVIEELKRVTWPTRQETFKFTMVVIVISLIIGAYIGIIDTLLAQALRALTG